MLELVRESRSEKLKKNRYLWGILFAINLASVIPSYAKNLCRTSGKLLNNKQLERDFMTIYIPTFHKNAAIFSSSL